MILATMALLAQAAAVCQPSAKLHRQLVSNFYREALIQKQPAAAFAKYVSPDFIEHKPDVPQGTRDGAAAFLAGLIKAVPQARWEVLRVIAAGELVALHARFTPAPGAPPYAIADFFRLKDCKIVEHWDVVAGPPKDQSNPNPRF
ncbi:MAG TPA: nuclear transport factor 2 family protein [Sphingomicrobium sp.]|jgi:predicted SnoaL-like aldol condensation-catalyzing enzyme